MNDFKSSVILLGIDWSKAAKRLANQEIKAEDKDFYEILDDLDEGYRKKLR